MAWCARHWHWHPAPARNGARKSRPGNFGCCWCIWRRTGRALWQSPARRGKFSWTRSSRLCGVRRRAWFVGQFASLYTWALVYAGSARLAELYTVLKMVHVGSVVVSAAGFVVRGLLMLAASPLPAQRWMRIAPHVVDTVLLASAIALAALLHQYPFVDGWLTAKVLALLAYIVLGSIALKRGPTRSIRAVAWIGALMVLAYIIAVARAHDPRAGIF
jgi:uncharacterized membrane protein SirB2